MSTRKPRDSQSVQPARGEPSTPEPQQSAPSGTGKSPARFAFLFWGLPLILFITIAVIKECGV